MKIKLNVLAYTVTGLLLLNGCNLTDKLNEANKVISNFSTEIGKLTTVKPMASDDYVVVITPTELKYATTSVNQLKRKYLNTNGTWNVKALCDHQKLELAFIDAITEQLRREPYNTDYDSIYRKFPEFVKDGRIFVIDYKLSSNGYKGKLGIWVDLINPQKADVYFSKADFNKRNDFHYKLHPKYTAELDPKKFPQITKSGYYDLGIDYIPSISVASIYGNCHYSIEVREKYVVEEHTFKGIGG